MRVWPLAVRGPWVRALRRRASQPDRCCERACERGRERTRETGQALIEWLMVSVLAMLAAVWAAGEFARQAEDAAGQAHAQWLLTVGEAVKRAVAAEQVGYSASASQPVSVLRELPVGVASPIAPWLKRLQAAGWLPQALAQTRAMSYEVSLLKLPSRGTCAKPPCARVVLLLAQPRPDKPVPDVASVLMALKGQGLAVTDLAPDRLRGPTFDLPNPPVGRQHLPVGSLALLAWRDDHEPPYVRVNESRQVTLSGGLVLGKRAAADGACSPPGLVMLDAAGQLQVCRDGRWGQAIKEHEHFRACLPQTREQAFRAAWFKYSGFWELFGGGVNCDCDAGFAPVKMVGEDGRVGSVTLRDGYLCQRL